MRKYPPWMSASLFLCLLIMLPSGDAWAWHPQEAWQQVVESLRDTGCTRQGGQWNSDAHVCEQPFRLRQPPEPTRWRCEPLQQGTPQFGYECQEVR